MKTTRLFARVFALTLALCAFCALALAQAEATISNLKKPPKEFLAFGDVVGVGPGLLQKLGLEEDDPIEILTPAGKSFVYRTKIHGTADTDLYAKQTIREVMQLEDGAILLKVRPVQWGTGPAQAAKLSFTTVAKPPSTFLDFGDAVGIGVDKMRAANGYPGMVGRITGPAGSRDVLIELIDRGPDTISMKKTLRDAIGVTEGAAAVTLEVLPAAEQKAKAIFWYKTLNEAVAKAAQDRRPILLFVYDESEASKKMEALFADQAVARAMQKTRKYRFTAAQDSATATRFNVTAAPAVILVTPGGKEIGRWVGEVDRGKVLAGIRMASDAVRAEGTPPPASED